MAEDIEVLKFTKATCKMEPRALGIGFRHLGFIYSNAPAIDRLLNGSIVHPSETLFQS